MTPTDPNRDKLDANSSVRPSDDGLPAREADGRADDNLDAKLSIRRSDDSDRLDREALEERLWSAIATVRDAYPRVPTDAPTDALVEIIMHELESNRDAVLRALGKDREHYVRREDYDEMTREARLSREATDRAVARAEAAERREQDLIEDLRVALVERDAAERKVARIEALVQPGWHTNRGYALETHMEAYSAGRNGFIDKVRAALADEGAGR